MKATPVVTDYQRVLDVLTAAGRALGTKDVARRLSVPYSAALMQLHAAEADGLAEHTDFYGGWGRSGYLWRIKK